MSSFHSNELEFINTDLDLYTVEGADPLLAWLGERMIAVSSAANRMTFELNDQPKTISESLHGFAHVVEEMPANINELWHRCTRRSFDIGLNRTEGSDKATLAIAVSPDDLKTLAALNGEIAFTLYPER